MFGALFKQAQAAIGSFVSYAVERASMVIPFIIAAAFAFAALAVKLAHELGSVLGMLAMAAVFVLIGLIVAAVQAARAPPAPVETSIDEASNVDPPTLEPEFASTSAFSNLDKELLTALAGALGPAAIPQLVPMALPRLLSLLLRNLPLVLAVGIAAFVLTRPSAAAGPAARPTTNGLDRTGRLAAAE